MGWSKSDYEGRVCWEQNGQRLFDTNDIDKLENETVSTHICTKNEGIGKGCLLFLFGLLVGILIVTVLL